MAPLTLGFGYNSWIGVVVCMGGGVEVGLSLCGLVLIVIIITARRISSSRLCSGVLLVSPLGRRTNGLPMANGGWATRLRQSSRLCAIGAQFSPAEGRSA